MSNDPFLTLNVFNKLEENNIQKSIDLVDENILVSNKIIKELTKILGSVITDIEIEYVKTVLYNFVSHSDNETFIFDLITKAELSADKKKLLKAGFISIKNRISSDEVSTNKFAEYLTEFGHDHVHQFSIMSEFRSISEDDGKIIRLIPSIVFSGKAHSPRTSEKEIIINFQLNIDTLDEIIKNMQDASKIVKKEIIFFKEKMGSDIIID